VQPSVPDDPLELLPSSAVVAVAMSGGVDSSVVAARVARRGLRAMGITLAMWPRDHDVVRDRGCCSIDAVDDARRVASALGLPHYVWNLEREFDQHVIADFVQEHRRGRTPNPCVRCNQEVKFGILLDRARAVGATHVATGHYARIGVRGRTFTLHRAGDARRDQSYVLHRLDQDQLSAAVFPLGAARSKADVRSEAAALGLATAAKPESQDLCFVTTSVRAELSRRLEGAVRPGAVLDGGGRAIGRHPGVPFLTVGQRSGFEVRPQRPDAAPLYVIEVRPADNVVVVGPREALRRVTVDAAGCSWVSGSAPAAGSAVAAQLRAHGDAHAATVEQTGSGSLRLRFAAAVEHVSPGQAVVLYDGDEVLGGGILHRAA
jgi:tRNA-specific 2-thiouridylase